MTGKPCERRKDEEMKPKQQQQRCAQEGRRRLQLGSEHEGWEVLSSVHSGSKLVPVADKISVPSASWGFQSFLGGQTMAEPTAGTEKLSVRSGRIWNCSGHLPTSWLTQGGQCLEGTEWSHSLPNRHGSGGLATLDFLEGKRSHLKESKRQNTRK